MKLGVAKNKKKILVSGYNNSMVIHPMWLRERVTDAKYLDKNNGQRLYDPSKIKKNIKIERALIKNKFLNIKFSDGVQSDYFIKDLINEINKNSFQKSLKLWNSNTKYKPIYKYEKNLFNTPMTILKSLKITVRALTKDDIKNRKLPNQTSGLVVTKIENNSPLAKSLEVNSIITHAQKKKIRSINDLIQITEDVLNSNQKTILLAIYNNQNQRRYIGVKLN